MVNDPAQGEELRTLRVGGGSRDAGGVGGDQDAGGLSVRGAEVRYGTTTAVAGVDLDVAAGEVVALLGPSGSGKSSLLRAVAGLEPLAAGRVRWDGEDVARVPVHRRGFGLLFQDGQLFPHRSVAGNVAYGLTQAPRGRRPSQAEREARVAELLELVGLAGYGPRPVTSLSGGQAQRVALARSLAPAPRVLLLDEPLSALDKGLRERLTSELRHILRATGTTALYVTHDHDEAFTVADRVAVLVEGRLAQVDEPGRLWREPRSREVAAFLGYGPFLAPEEAAVLVPSVEPAAARSATARAERSRPVAESVPIATDSATATSGADAGRLLGLGPDALHVVDDDAGVRLAVVSARFVRGRTEVVVRLPDRAGGSVATAVVPGATEPGAEVVVRLDLAGTVVVPG